MFDFRILPAFAAVCLLAACAEKKPALTAEDLYDPEQERLLEVGSTNWSQPRKPVVVVWEGVGKRLEGVLHDETLTVDLPAPHPDCTGRMDLPWGRWDLTCGEKLSAKGDTRRRATVYALLGDGTDNRGRKVAVYLKRGWCPEGGCRQGVD